VKLGSLELDNELIRVALVEEYILGDHLGDAAEYGALPGDRGDVDAFGEVGLY
jgi:hypothetical protein